MSCAPVSAFLFHWKNSVKASNGPGPGPKQAQ